MKVIRCDMCGKESSMSMHQSYIDLKPIDLCTECHKKYGKAKEEFDIEDRKLKIEYEKKRQQTYSTIIKKHGLKDLNE